MRHYTLLLAGALALGAGAVGCKGPDLVMAPNTAAPDPLPEGAYPQIVLLDGLESKIVKEKPTIRMPDGGDTLFIRVPVRSVVDRAIHIRWRVRFTNDAGDQIDDNPVWHEENILPRTRINLEARSLSTRATKWDIEIRHG